MEAFVSVGVPAWPRPVGGHELWLLPLTLALFLVLRSILAPTRARITILLVSVAAALVAQVSAESWGITPTIAWLVVAALVVAGVATTRRRRHPPPV